MWNCCCLETLIRGKPQSSEKMHSLVQNPQEIVQFLGTQAAQLLMLIPHIIWTVWCIEWHIWNGCYLESLLRGKQIRHES